MAIRDFLEVGRYWERRVLLKQPDLVHCLGQSDKLSEFREPTMVVTVYIMRKPLENPHQQKIAPEVTNHQNGTNASCSLVCVAPVEISD